MSSEFGDSGMNTSHGRYGAPNGGYPGFFERLWIFFRTYFVIAGMLSTLLVGLFIFAIYKFATSAHIKTAPTVTYEATPNVLHLKLEGVVQDVKPRAEEILMARFFEEQTYYSLGELLNAIEVASTDDAVKGLFIEIADVSISQSSILALRDAISKFKMQGKMVSSFLSDVSDRDYLLASAADKVITPPVSNVFLKGPGLNLMYMGEALRKLGVGIEVVRAGKFKSAFEPLVQDAPSEEVKLMYSELEESLRKFLIAEIATSRNVSTEKVEQWYKRGLYTSKASVTEGIVDRLAYIGTSIETFKTETKVKKVQNFESYIHYAHDQMKDRVKEAKNSREAIGYIEAVGDIIMGEERDERAISPEHILKELDWAANEDSVKAVVLRINSPGGVAIAADRIWEGVRLLAEVKPVVVSMGRLAASGGYYIAAPATKIIAEPTTITGSIGVIGMVPNFKNFEEKYGLSFHLISNSDRKNYLNPGTSLSPEDHEIIGESIDETYQTFLAKVASGRSMSVQDVDAVAQGRVWTGMQAIKIGLVDEIGGRDHAFKVAKKLGGLNVDKKYPVKTYIKKRPSLLDCLADPEDAFDCLQRREATLNLRSTLTTIVSTYEKSTLSAHSRRLVRPLSRLHQLSSHGNVLTFYTPDLAVVNTSK